MKFREEALRGSRLQSPPRNSLSVLTYPTGLTATTKAVFPAARKQQKESGPEPKPGAEATTPHWNTWVSGRADFRHLRGLCLPPVSDRGSPRRGRARSVQAARRRAVLVLAPVVLPTERDVAIEVHQPTVGDHHPVRVAATRYCSTCSGPPNGALA